MSRIVYTPTSNPKRGFAFQVRDESPCDDSTPLAEMNRFACKALDKETPKHGLPAWWLGPWYECDECGKRCLEWRERPSCNAGLAASATTGRTSAAEIRWYCPECSKRKRKVWNEARVSNLAAEHARRQAV